MKFKSFYSKQLFVLLPVKVRTLTFVLNINEYIRKIKINLIKFLKNIIGQKNDK